MSPTTKSVLVQPTNCPPSTEKEIRTQDVELHNKNHSVNLLHSV